MERNYHVYAKKEAQLAQAIGTAVSRWARLEHAIMSTFATATGLKQRTTAALFIHVKNSSLLLDMTDIAVRHLFLDEEEQDNRKRPEITYWTSIVQYIRELSGDRNYIAHTDIVAHGEGNPDEADWALAEPMIGPSQAAYFAGQDRFIPIGVGEVYELINDMQQVIEALMDFQRDLAARSTSQPKYHEPIARRRPSRKQRQEAARRSPKRPPSPSAQ